MACGSRNQRLNLYPTTDPREGGRRRRKMEEEPMDRPAEDVVFDKAKYVL